MVDIPESFSTKDLLTLALEVRLPENIKPGEYTIRLNFKNFLALLQDGWEEYDPDIHGNEFRVQGESFDFGGNDSD